MSECQYSKDNNIPEHRCAVRCIYEDQSTFEAEKLELLAALKAAHSVLQTASRQLTEDHKMVLMGRGWGWRTLATIEGVIAKADGTP